ncbi:hypothetical protein ACAF76_006315 [Brevibacillus sp. TJ4]|uniref:hypothetical protein n=1 Tax=Brevibacillus sp. TJ4 TaxID=3234853 RepID=UPI0037D3B404
MKHGRIKEPIRKTWIWVVLGLIVLGNVPWYIPESAVEPFILGFPFWAFVIVVFSFVLCAYLSWICTTQWHMVEDEEEGRQGGGDER